MIRLGDGTDESHRRMEQALEMLWPFTGEPFDAAPFEETMHSELGLNREVLKSAWQQTMEPVFAEATLSQPATAGTQRGGKWGRHTEYMGYLLAEMQYLQRAYPNAVW